MSAADVALPPLPRASSRPAFLKGSGHLLGGLHDLVAELVEQLEAEPVALRGLVERRARQLEDEGITRRRLRAEHRIEQLRERVAAGLGHAPTSTGVPRCSATPPWQSSTSPAVDTVEQIDADLDIAFRRWCRVRSRRLRRRR